MKAPLGAEVGIAYDTDTPVCVGDFLVTSTGRTYLITKVRLQQRGQKAGITHHLRCMVVQQSDIEPGDTVYGIQWHGRYKK